MALGIIPHNSITNGQGNIHQMRCPNSQLDDHFSRHKSSSPSMNINGGHLNDMQTAQNGQRMSFLASKGNNSAGNNLFNQRSPCTNNLFNNDNHMIAQMAMKNLASYDSTGAPANLTDEHLSTSSLGQSDAHTIFSQYSPSQHRQNHHHLQHHQQQKNLQQQQHQDQGSSPNNHHHHQQQKQQPSVTSNGEGSCPGASNASGAAYQSFVANSTMINDEFKGRQSLTAHDLMMGSDLPIANAVTSGNAKNSPQSSGGNNSLSTTESNDIFDWAANDGSGSNGYAMGEISDNMPMCI